MPTLNLPPVCQGANNADSAVNALGFIGGQSVIVNAGGCRTATDGYTDRLIERLLSVGGAAEAVIIDGPHDLGLMAREAAARHGVHGRLRVA